MACGRLARATWLMVAKGAGGAARSVGRAHDIDPGHRRDGIALALLGFAVVTAASCWLDAARPVGAWIDTGLRAVVGGAVVLLPLLAAAAAVLLMRTEPDPENRPRLILGSAMIGLPILGLWHLWSGSPQSPDGRLHGAGFVGFAIGGPLADGLTAWIAAPLLCIGVLFGVLLLTGTTLREAPETLRTMFRGDYGDDDYYDDYDDYDDQDYDQDYDADADDAAYDSGVSTQAGGTSRFGAIEPDARVDDTPTGNRVPRWTTTRSMKSPPRRRPRSKPCGASPRRNPRRPNPPTPPWSSTAWWRAPTRCRR